MRRKSESDKFLLLSFAISTFGSTDCIILYMPWIPWGVEHSSSNASAGKNRVPKSFICFIASCILSAPPKKFCNSANAFSVFCATNKSDNTGDKNSSAI